MFYNISEFHNHSLTHTDSHTKFPKNFKKNIYFLAEVTRYFYIIFETEEIFVSDSYSA